MTVELAEKLISALEGIQTALSCIAGVSIGVGIIFAIGFALIIRKER